MIPALVAALGPLLPGLIRGVESLFAAKPKSGDVKKATLIDVLRTLAGKMIDTGAVSVPAGTAAPSDDSLATLIEAEFQKLKSDGALTPPPPTGALFIVRGTVTPIQ